MTSTRRWRAPRPADDAGFGLTEIMVSLALLAVLSVSFAPLLIGALNASARNASMTTATQLANRQLERARSSDTCTDFVNFLSSPITPNPETDSQGRDYTMTQTPPAAVTCPGADDSILVSYEIRVDVAGPSAPPPVRIATQIWLVGP